MKKILALVLALVLVLTACVALADRTDNMLSYSPYHNVKPGTLYPRLLIQTGENDNNVPPYHGKKFAARLQHDADERHPVLLTVLAHGSHNRGVGDEYYYNIAQMQTFVEIGLAEADNE